MAVMDEFKEERESIKSKPLKEKLGYVADYYKWPIIGTIIGIICVVSFIHMKVTTKEEVLNGMLLNTSLYGSEYGEEGFQKLSEDFLGTLELDSHEYEVILSNSYNYYISEDASSQNVDYQMMTVIMAQISAGTVDFITANSDTMIHLAYQDCFMDLSEVLSEEDYAVYEPYLLYIDNAIIQERREKYENMEEVPDIEYPDPSNPEAMEVPIPVLVDMSQCEILQEIYNHPTEDRILFGMLCNSPHEENTVEFLKYLMK